MIDLGIRIELYELATLDTDQRRLMGALCRSSGYRALAVPTVGTRLSVSSLRLSHPHDWTPLVRAETLRVQDIVHLPVPLREGEVPTWWEDPEAAPAVVVVLRAALGGAIWTLEPQMRQFAEDGWTLENVNEGSALQRTWNAATARTRELALHGASGTVRR
ncbi:hypothetical protein [Streptomyces goshikiensis]|uniref:hypothetical protein n=1 Tax=Streptomyces goshikiensis TaxID=1942 RepID=UPI0036969335